MNTQIGLDRRAAAWLADGPTELSDRVLDAALREVHLTHQRRALRAPWRFPFMPALSRATAVAAVVLVAVVGAGGLLYLNANPIVPGGPPTPTPTATSAASQHPAGILGWKMYTSAVYDRVTLGYPEDWSVNGAATREWHAGDGLTADAPYADRFASGADNTIGLFVWQMPRSAGVDVESVAGLKAWAQTFCNDVGGSTCEDFLQRATPMCVSQKFCRYPALLVPTAAEQYAFIADRGSLIFTNVPDVVTVVVVARPDDFPSAARYGGSVELLKSILMTMDVWTPQPGQVPGQPPE